MDDDLFEELFLASAHQLLVAAAVALEDGRAVRGPRTKVLTAHPAVTPYQTLCNDVHPDAYHRVFRMYRSQLLRISGVAQLPAATAAAPKAV